MTKKSAKERRDTIKEKSHDVYIFICIQFVICLQLFAGIKMYNNGVALFQ